MNPIGSPHAAIAKRLNRLVARAAADGIVLVSVQDPLRLDAYNEPEPDFMLLQPRADDYRASHPSAADVLLLVEISDSSLTYDRGRKLALYAKFGVPEVWIVDIAGASVEVFRQPKGRRLLFAEAPNQWIAHAGAGRRHRNRRRSAPRVKPVPPLGESLDRRGRDARWGRLPENQPIVLINRTAIIRALENA